MQLTQNQLTELEGIYNLSVGNKDKEVKKLMESLKKSINFINFNCQVQCFSRWKNWGTIEYSRFSVYKKLDEIPITVLIYIFTKNDKYLNRYKKSTHKNREYIYYGGNCYYIDNIYLATNDMSIAIIK